MTLCPSHIGSANKLQPNSGFAAVLIFQFLIFLFLYCIMSFNTFWKVWKFLEVNFVPGIFWGFSWEVTRDFIGFCFLPSLDHHLCHLKSVSTPTPSPLPRHAIGQKQKHFPPLGTEIFVRTQCTSSAIFFLPFCPQAWLPCQPVYLFFFQNSFLRAMKTVYRRQFFFLSPYLCIPPLPFLPPFTKIF